MHPFYEPSSQLLLNGNYWWIGLVSMAMCLLFWAVVMIIAYIIFKKHFMRQSSHTDNSDQAMSILRERYAKGEINAEEFKQKKADLENTVH